MTLARWTSPRLSTERRPDQRTVDWLELFYDLVYVAALIQLGQSLAADLSGRAIGRFVLLFSLLWWAWTSTTLLMNRVRVDDLLHRVLMIAQMFAIGTVAVLVEGAFGVHAAGFAVAYAFIRLTLAVMYARVWLNIPRARPLVDSFVVVHLTTAVLWMASAVIPVPAKFWVWGAAFVIDIASIASPWTRRRLTHDFPPDREHRAERYALFTIIVLGESFIKIIGAVANQGVTVSTLVNGALAFLVVAGLWWTYFDDVAESPIRSRSGRDPMAALWSVLHLPMAMGLTAAGVGLGKLALSEIDTPIEVAFAWLLTLSLALVLLSVAGLDAITQNRHFGVGARDRIIPRFGAIALLVGVALLSQQLPSSVFGLAVAVIVIGQIGFEVLVAKRADQAVRVDVENVIRSALAGDTCEHLTDLGDTAPRTSGCTRCIENGLVWVHLRFCTICGQVGCCDDSQGRHASAHFLETGHPTIRPLEAGEDWAWCYVDRAGRRLVSQDERSAR